jgi:hypothetical protein
MAEQNNTARDELAARMAAAMADSDRSADEVAARAYAVADALIAEGGREHRDAHIAQRWPDSSYDVSWDAEPRWSRADLASLQARSREAEAAGGPGLASTRRTAAGGDEAREETA